MFVKQIESFCKFPLTQDQENLVKNLSNFIFHKDDCDIFILDGYAGTGKTTIISALIKTLPFYGIRTELLAPTGRAAKVLSNRSLQQAYTIHKKIYYTQTDDYSNISLKLKENKNHHTLYIIDEASMIGEGDNLLSDLFSYVKNGVKNKAILLGDKAQLPPVGSNESFALNPDYLRQRFFEPIEYYQLTQVVRQALQSGILKNAANIRWALNNKLQLPIFKTQNHKDFKRIESIDFEDTLVNQYRQIGEKEVIVVTRSNFAANQLNQYIRNRILEKENIIDIGEKLMSIRNNYYWQTENEYSDFIANGDIVEVTNIYSYEEKFGFNFANIEARINESKIPIELTIMLDTLSEKQAHLSQEKERQLYNNIFSYYQKDCNNKALIHKAVKEDKYFNALQVKFSKAITCHKAQGGDWHTAFILNEVQALEAINQDYFRWLYTAVTRAREQIFLVNFSEEFFLE
ncbi:MAG: AAA family ATPase [Bacteroidales bacterium]|nr:AAA family ATPase [Bacteroidales bacterium]